MALNGRFLKEEDDFKQVQLPAVRRAVTLARPSGPCG